ncbi:796_t:CDS:2 [Entrophospora sp. SA101]|nr:796_t:CDS:2 [Entrophospora sp. SA101]
MVTKSKTTKQQYKSLLQGEAKLELDEATKKAFATFIKKAKKHKFINGVYQEAQQTLSYLFDYPPYLGNLKIYTKVIYLNSLFITEQFNITNNPEYGLPNLANTIAHEIAHCLIADYDPKQAGKHDDSTHEKIKIQNYACQGCTNCSSLPQIDLRTKQGVFTYLIKKRSCYLSRLQDKIQKLTKKTQTVELEIQQYQQALKLEKEQKEQIKA